MTLALGVVIGFAIGALNTYVLVRHGWKPAAVIVVAFCACVFVMAWRTDIGYSVEAALLLSFGLSRFVVEPRVRR